MSLQNFSPIGIFFTTLGPWNAFLNNFTQITRKITSAKSFLTVPVDCPQACFCKISAHSDFSSLCYDLRDAFLSNFTQIAQWKMTAPKPIFYIDLNEARPMVLQNFSPIRCFLHNKWPQNIPRKCGGRNKTNKKSRQNHGGSRRDEMPQ